MPLIKIPRLFLLNENSCQGLSLISDIFCGMTGDSVSVKFLPEFEVPDSLYMVGGDLGEVRAGP